MKALVCCVLFLFSTAVFARGPNPQGWKAPYPAENLMPTLDVYGSQKLTNCTIPPGVYRLDATNWAYRDRVAVHKLVMMIHINRGGLVTLTLHLRTGGHEEFYLINPYVSASDLANMCNGNRVNLWFADIDLHGKKLNGNITGDFKSGYSSNYLILNGYVERYDPSWGSKVRVDLSGQQASANLRH